MLRPRNMLILLVLLPWASGMQAQAAATDPNEALQALQFQNEKPSAWQFEREDSWALKFENDDFSALQFEDDGRPWYCKTEDSAVARPKAIPAANSIRRAQASVGDSRSDHEASRLWIGCG